MNVNQCSNALGEEQRKWMWSFDVEKGGGVRLALGVHLVDLARSVSYTHLRAHETVLDLVCRLLLEKKKTKHRIASSTRYVKTN